MPCIFLTSVREGAIEFRAFFYDENLNRQREWLWTDLVLQYNIKISRYDSFR